MTYTGRDSSDIYVSERSHSQQVACNVRNEIKSSRLTALTQETDDVRDTPQQTSTYFSRIARRAEFGPSKPGSSRHGGPQFPNISSGSRMEFVGRDPTNPDVQSLGRGSAQ